MLHVFTLFTLNPATEQAFVRALRIGGDWYARAKRTTPHFIAADLLRHQDFPLFVCIDFWTTPGAYSASAHLPEVRELMRDRIQMSVHALELGTFSFPSPSDREPQLTRCASFH